MTHGLEQYLDALVGKPALLHGRQIGMDIQTVRKVAVEELADHEAEGAVLGHEGLLGP